MREWRDFVEEGAVPKELTEEHPIIAIYGGYQVGKSTLLNCLLGQYVALVGKGIATTALVSRYRYGRCSILRYRTKPDSIYQGDLRQTTLEQVRDRNFLGNIDMESGFHLEVEAPAELLEKCDIVDTPGYDASEQDNTAALNAMDHIHYILFVIPNRGLTQTEKELLLKISRNGIPISVLMNCSIGRRSERWIPDSDANLECARECESWLSSMNVETVPVKGQKVYLCNFLFYWFYAKAFEQSIPDIVSPDTLQKHIVETLQEEGYGTDRDTIIRLSGVCGLIDALAEQILGYDSITHKIGVGKYEPIL